MAQVIRLSQNFEEMKKVYYLCAAVAVLKYLNDHADKSHGQRLELHSDGDGYWLVGFDDGKPTEEADEAERMDAENLYDHLISTVMIAAANQGKELEEINLDDAFYSYVRSIELPVTFNE